MGQAAQLAEWGLCAAWESRHTCPQRPAAHAGQQPPPMLLRLQALGVCTGSQHVALTSTLLQGLRPVRVGETRGRTDSPGSGLLQGSASSQSASADVALELSEQSQTPECPGNHQGQTMCLGPQHPLPAQPTHTGGTHRLSLTTASVPNHLGPSWGRTLELRVKETSGFHAHDDAPLKPAWAQRSPSFLTVGPEGGVGPGS